MIRRSGGNLRLLRADVSDASKSLEREGFAHVRGVISREEIDALWTEINDLFEATDKDRAHDQRDEFRHGMFNRSPLSQKAIGKRSVLDVIEPLLGEDCHVIANTAWRNTKGHQGGPWHCDAGPHIPRDEGVQWPDAIPYPVFAIGVHIFLEDCPMEAGPTAVLAGSHRSGRLPPSERIQDLDLTFDNKSPVYLPAKAGDAIFFVSDVWHRGTPAQPGHRRFFLQAHYGRRDIAQRVFTTAEISHVTPEADARAETERERKLIGLHAPYFYDA